MSGLLQPGDPVILLLRVSSTRQKTAESIQTQDEQLRKYCSAFPLVIHAVFEDNGVSGTSLNRDGLEAALAEARQGTAKAILVWNLARLTRADELDDLLLRKELREMRMPLIVASTGRDFTSEDEGDELLSSVERWANRQERRKIIRDSSAGKRRNVANGRYGGGVVDFGLQVNPVTKHWEIRENEAQWVRQVFNWTTEDEDLGGDAIANRLNSLEIRSKRGGRWSGDQVRAMLSNSSYMGEKQWGKRNKSAVQGEILIQRPPAIVPVEQWHAAQEAIRRRQKFKGPSVKGKYPLQGKIKCGVCGYTYVGQTQTKPNGRLYRYYKRSSAKMKHRELAIEDICKCRQVAADRIEDLVWGYIVQLLDHPPSIRQYLVGLSDAEAPVDPNAIERIRSQRLKKRTARSNLIDEISLAPDEETKNAYRSKIAVIARDLHALDEEEVAIADRSNRLRQQRELAAEAEQSLERLRARLGQVSVDQRMDIFQTLIESIVVSPGTPRTFQVNLRLQQDSGLEMVPLNFPQNHEVSHVHALRLSLR